MANQKDKVPKTKETPEMLGMLKPEAKKGPVLVRKKITCQRCKGTGTWVSSKTGVRAERSSEPLYDLSRPCPKCKGFKFEVVMIPEAQMKAEQAAMKRKRAAAAAKIDREAEAAKQALIDAEVE